MTVLGRSYDGTMMLLWRYYDSTMKLLWLYYYDISTVCVMMGYQVIRCSCVQVRQVNF
jgi:hypothetical protein